MNMFIRLSVLASSALLSACAAASVDHFPDGTTGYTILSTT